MTVPTAGPGEPKDWGQEEALAQVRHESVLALLPASVYLCFLGYTLIKHQTNTKTPGVPCLGKELSLRCHAGNDLSLTKVPLNTSSTKDPGDFFEERI